MCVRLTPRVARGLTEVPMTNGRSADALQKQAKALGDPTRVKIFHFIREAEQPVDIAVLTAHVELNHNAVRQHLTKLVDAELVQQSSAHRGGRGRPHLLYEMHPAAVSQWLDQNPYERLSVLLAEVSQTGDDPAEVGRRAGRSRPRPEAGSNEHAVRDLAQLMAQLGFLPQTSTIVGGSEIVLRHCPFTSAVLRDAATVCTLHRGLAEGFLEGTGTEVTDLVVRDPRIARCLLRVSAVFRES